MSQEDFNPLYVWAEKTRTEFDAEYNLEGLKKIEDAIVNSRDIFESWPEKDQFTRVNTFGAFLGQCMVVNLNGEWCRNGDSIGIKFEKQGIWTDPFQKVWKQFQKDGAAHSISSFYGISLHFEMNADLK